MLAYSVNYAILSSFRSTYFVHRRSIDGFNTLIFSPKVESKDISPAHFFGWFQQALNPDTSSHIFKTPVMTCVKSWYKFYGTQDMKKSRLLELFGPLME